MMDQAQRLREMTRAARQRARVLAVTSGKGGVGKTSTSINLGIALAARGCRVVVLDADLGTANVEVLLGLSSFYNLEHVIRGEKELREIIVRGPGGIELIPGSSGLAQVADMSQAQRQRLITGLQELQTGADYIIIDTMAGIGRNAVSFAAAADEVLLISTPEPTSIVDAYAMLKTLHQTREDMALRLIVNMAMNDAQVRAVTMKLANVARQYLGRNLSLLGYIPRDPHVPQSVMQSTPFVLQYPQSAAARCMVQIADRLHAQPLAPPKQDPGFLRRFAQSFGLAG